MTGPPYSIVALMQKIDCLHNSAVMELMRGLRNQLTELITGLGAQELGPMSLGLSHSLSRYKLKFSPEKVSPICAHFLAFFIAPSLAASHEHGYCIRVFYSFVALWCYIFATFITSFVLASYGCCL